MHLCHTCKKTLNELPFTCPWCGQVFCITHLLPENHRCSRPRQYARKPHLRICRSCGRELKGPVIPCTWCGKVLCDSCRLPGNHLCQKKVW